LRGLPAAVISSCRRQTSVGRAELDVLAEFAAAEVRAVGKKSAPDVDVIRQLMICFPFSAHY